MGLSNKHWMIVFGFLCLISIVLAGYFFSVAGLGVTDFFSFDFASQAQKFATMNFLIVLILLPLIGGLISAAPQVLSSRETTISIAAGIILGGIINFLLFPNLAGFFWPALFFLIGALFAVQVVFFRKQEMQAFVGIRLANAGIQRQMAIVAIGLVIWGALVVLPQQAVFVQNFENQLLQIAVPVGEDTATITDTLKDTIITLSIQSQRQVLGDVARLPEYQLVQASPQSQDQNFVQAFSNLQQQVESPQHRTLLEERFDLTLQQTSFSDEELISKIKQQVPLLQQMEDWLWLFFSFGLASLFLLVSTILLQPLGIVWGIFFQRVFGFIKKREGSGVPKSPFEISASTAKAPPASEMPELFAPGEV